MLPCLARLVAPLVVLVSVSAWASGTPPAMDKAAMAAPAVAAKGDLPQVKLGAVQVYGLLAPRAYVIAQSDSATHTVTPLIDIPQTVQAIPIALLHEQNAQSLADAMRNAPGVSVHQGEGNRDELVIRGVKTKSAFFLNGVPDDTERFRDLYNVQEIDVLQGSSAVMFGRGGAGGVVNVITKKPLSGRFVHLAAQWGSWRHRRLTLDVNAPLGRSKGLRVNLMGEDSHGYRRYAYLRRYGVDPELRLDLGRDTMLQLGAQRLYDKRRADRGIPSRNGRPAAVPVDTFFGSPTQNFARSMLSAVHARLEHYVGDLTFRDTFRAARINKYYRNLYAGSAVAADGTLTLTGYRHGHDRTSYFNETEVEWDVTAGAFSHTLLLGLDLGYEADQDVEYRAHPIPGVAVAHPVAVGVFDIPGRRNDVSGRSSALYAEDQMAIGPWKVLLGLRYSRFSVDARFHWPQPASAHHVDTDWSPRVGLIYQPSPNQSLYASVTRTFTPQGSNLALSMKSPEGADLDPETSTNYELGYKAQWLDGVLVFTGDLFQMQQENVLSHDPADPSRLLQTGAQRVRGFELSMVGKLGPHWRVDAGYARLVARVTRATKHAAPGARVPLVPRQQFSLWAKYRIDAHWGVGGGLVGNSRLYTGFANDVVLPGYVRMDLMGYWQAGRYRLALHLDNATDITYYPTANGNNQIMPGAPRSIDLRLRVAW